MDLSTRYLGLDLRHPLIVGASPLADDLDTVRRLVDAGAAAIVMPSLFEEQILQEQVADFLDREIPSESFAEATSYFPTPSEFTLGPERYLERLARIREAVHVPVIGSLNGVTAGGWLEYARLIEDAGAHALELNVYHVATDPLETGEEVDNRVVEIVRRVTSSVGIPVAIKLSPYYSSLANLAHRLDRAGIAGLVLFNRFYQPDIDPVELQVVPALRLSDSSELLLRLRWMAILHGRIDASLAVSGGVHSGIDAIKSVMAGASAVQLVSCLLRHGPGRLRYILHEMTTWMEENEHDSLAAMRGNMSLFRCPDPQAFERGNYTRVLQSWDARRRAGDTWSH